MLHVRTHSSSFFVFGRVRDQNVLTLQSLGLKRGWWSSGTGNATTTAARSCFTPGLLVLSCACACEAFYGIKLVQWHASTGPWLRCMPRIWKWALANKVFASILSVDQTMYLFCQQLHVFVLFWGGPASPSTKSICQQGSPFLPVDDSDLPSCWRLPWVLNLFIYLFIIYIVRIYMYNVYMYSFTYWSITCRVRACACICTCTVLIYLIKLKAFNVRG